MVFLASALEVTDLRGDWSGVMGTRAGANPGGGAITAAEVVGVSKALIGVEDRADEGVG
jgi:hypothetical protein